MCAFMFFWFVSDAFCFLAKRHSSNWTLQKTQPVLRCFLRVFNFDRLPVLENTDDLSLEESMNNVGSAMLSRFPRWFVLSHVEIQQCQLAATLLAAAKSMFNRAYSQWRNYSVINSFLLSALRLGVGGRFGMDGF